jgi:hypothetical protein
MKNQTNDGGFRLPRDQKIKIHSRLDSAQFSDFRQAWRGKAMDKQSWTDFQNYLS